MSNRERKWSEETLADRLAFEVQRRLAIVIYHKIYVDSDGNAVADLKEPFKLLLSPRIARAADLHDQSFDDADGSIDRELEALLLDEEGASARSPRSGDKKLPVPASAGSSRMTTMVEYIGLCCAPHSGVLEIAPWAYFCATLFGN